MNYESLKNRALLLKSKKQTLETSIANKERDLKTKLAQLNTTKDNLANLEQSLKVMQSLINTLALEEINNISSLLTYALTTVLEEDYEVKILISDKRANKSAEFILNHNGLETPLTYNGGGVKSVIGLVLNIYYILKYNLPHILFLDEYLTQISKQYLPNVFSFLSELSSKYDFIFVLVTHDSDIMSYSNRVYEVVEGRVREVKIDYV